jgi:trehalose/maltose hydrolase-like predicted phosphorylase
VLVAAHVAGLFDVTVDGTDAQRMRLAGKPDPALFLEAARRLRVTPDRTVVIEDSEAGVQAAARGGFALVIGMDRTGDDRLRSAGADLVLTDLAALDLAGLDPALTRKNRGWAGGESGSDPWLLRYIGFDPATEGLREALCTLGNGYWGTRGAAAESSDDGVHYPGTYLAGVYNRVQTDLGDRTVEDEHLVNAPNWLSLGFRVADGDWFDVGHAELVTYLQELDLRRGVLTRVIRWRDEAGRTTRVTSRRFVSQAAPHVAVLDTTFEAEDWTGPLTVRSALEGRVFNRNVAADRLLSNMHLIPRTSAEIDFETVLLEVETTSSGIHIALAARSRVLRDEVPVDAPRRLLTDAAGWVAHEFALHLEPGHPVRVEQTVVVSTSRDRAIVSPARAVAT